MNNFTEINAGNDPWCPSRYAVSAFFTTSMALITSAAFIGNLLVFIAVYKTPSLRTSTNYYYVNMAVSDYLASLTAWPLYLSNEIITVKGSLFQNPLATVGCKVGMYVRVVSTSVSILNLVLIAVDRFIATVFPLKASQLSSKKRVSLMCATWAISMGYCVPMFYFSKVEDVGEERFCRFAWNDEFALMIYYLAGIIGIVIAPLVAIVVLYSRITRVLRQRPKLESGAGNTSVEQKRRNQGQNIMKIFKAIVIAYSVCFLLFCGYLGLKITIPELFVKDRCKWILGFAYFLSPTLSTAINPAILFSFSSNFRLALRSLMCKCSLKNYRSCFKWKDISVTSANENITLPELVTYRQCPLEIMG